MNNKERGFMLDPDDEQVINECKDGGAILVTWDRVMRVAAGGLTPYEMMDKAMEEEEAKESEGEQAEKGLAEISRLRKLTPTQLTVLAKGADKTLLRFQEHIPVTRETAKLIRQLRIERGYSWRAIARFCSVLWGAPWGGNQIAGVVICEKAAKLFGEDFMQPPWN